MPPSALALNALHGSLVGFALLYPVLVFGRGRRLPPGLRATPLAIAHLACVLFLVVPAAVPHLNPLTVAEWQAYDAAAGQESSWISVPALLPDLTVGHWWMEASGLPHFGVVYRGLLGALLLASVATVARARALGRDTY